MEETPYYSPTEVAALLGTTYNQVYRLMLRCWVCRKWRKECEKDGEHPFKPSLRAVNISSGPRKAIWRIPKEEVERFKKERGG